MSARSARRRWLRLTLPALAITVLVLAGAPASQGHDHAVGGLYNPECQLLAVATLAGANALPIHGLSLWVALAAPLVLTSCALAPPSAPPVRRRSRAPPLLLA